MMQNTKSELLEFQRYFLLTKQFNKLFGIGANKTGTTTLACIAKKIYGLKTKQRPGVATIHQLIGGNYSGFIDHMNCHDFHQDVPASIKSFYVAMDALFPNSKFILTIRNSKEWFESFFEFYCKRVIGAYVDSKYSKQDHPLFRGHDKRWFYYSYKYELNSLRDLKTTQYENFTSLKNKILSTQFREKCISNYENRNREIQDYFEKRPQDLLVLDISDKNLCEKMNIFLGIDAKAVIYRTPHKNSRTSQKEFSNKSIIDGLIIDKNIFNNL